jgi:hypothetical protein
MNGEISTLDPGGFGAVTITKSITINGGGGGAGFGAILAAGTNGIIINITNAADPEKTVRLNHLDINGAVTGLNGIRVIAANVVHIENTFIDGFRGATAGNGNGIKVEAASQVHIRNTSVRNCLNDGLNATAAAGQVVLSVVNSKFSKNGNGIRGLTNVVGSIVNTEVNASVIGIDADGAGTQLNIDSCNIAFNSTGIQAGAGASVARISNNFIAQNSTGVHVAGGQVFTSGTNRLLGNTTPVNGALQAITQPQ